MRGSAVVQGLKSFTSKLHLQLPLGPKDSQRLLIALTTAFQTHLDEAHPRQAADGEVLPKTQSNARTSDGDKGRHASSATLADRHLAAVLTNPLLAPRTTVRQQLLDINTAEAALRRDPTRDPMSLLEEYHEKGSATIPIASLCLRAHRAMTLSLPQNERQAFIERTAAGKRALSWLSRSQIYKQPAFLRDETFKELLVSHLALDGEDEFLWNCLQTDQPASGHASMADKLRVSITYQMASAKLLQHNYTSADDALDAFFRACELLRAHGRDDALEWSINKTAVALAEALAYSFKLRAGTDPARYERLTSTLLTTIGDRTPRLRLATAKLQLVHPSAPTPFPALELVKQAFESSGSDAALRSVFEDPPSGTMRRRHLRFLSQLAGRLRTLGRGKDAEWILSLRRQLYPQDTASDQRPASVEPVSQSRNQTENIATDDITLLSFA